MLTKKQFILTNELFNKKKCGICEDNVTVQTQTIRINDWAIWGDCKCKSTFIIELEKFKEEEIGKATNINSVNRSRTAYCIMVNGILYYALKIEKEEKENDDV